MSTQRTGRGGDLLSGADALGVVLASQRVIIDAMLALA